MTSPFSDDIVTRLRNSFTNKDYPMLKDHCESCAIPKEFGGHHDNCLYDQAAYEIERLRKELQWSLLQTNVMRNIALVPLDKQGEKIEQLLADRDKWRKIALDEHAGWCQLHHAGSCEEYIVQQQALRDE